MLPRHVGEVYLPLSGSLSASTAGMPSFISTLIIRPYPLAKVKVIHISRANLLELVMQTLILPSNKTFDLDPFKLQTAKVKVRHISTANILEMVKDVENITFVIESEVHV